MYPLITTRLLCRLLICKFRLLKVSNFTTQLYIVYHIFRSKNLQLNSPIKWKSEKRRGNSSFTLTRAPRSGHLYIRCKLTTWRKRTYSNILKILPPKNENFQIKNSDIFHISAQNIDCGYSLEPPRWGGSNEYQQSMFWAEIRKIMYTPVNPSFTIQKWGLRGSKLYRHVFVMRVFRELLTVYTKKDPDQILFW